MQRFKARLIAKEFLQIHDIDYDETFAFTVRINTLRAVLALIVIEYLETEQVDINNVFTESTLKYLIYMNVSLEVIVNQKEYLKLLQSLYDLKQAAHDWYFICNAKLIKLEFVSSESNLYIYIHKDRQLIVLVYVNDIIIVSSFKDQV